MKHFRKDNTMRLRHMSATVSKEYVKLHNELYNETIEGEMYVLTSYNSRVACIDNRNAKVYLLPRWDYSQTTSKHVHAFIQDHGTSVRDKSYREIRKEIQNDAYNSMFEYMDTINGSRY